MIRRMGEPVRQGQKYRKRPGVYAVLRDGDSVLLTHQAVPLPEFQLPGGGIDAGEHPLPALHREVYEETGWTMRVERRLGAFRRFTYMPEYDLWAEKLCTIYLARPARQIGPPAEADHTAHMVKIADAIEMVGNSGDAMFLRRVLAGTA